jgi:tetratricopeptide (TPR) repeat protein
LEWNTRGVEAARKIAVPDPEIESNALLNVADNLLGLRRLSEAGEAVRQVERLVEQARRHDQYLLWRYSQHLYCTSGELQLALGEFERALSCADACLHLAEESQSRKYIVKARSLRGRTLIACGRLPEAERELTPALELARLLGNPPQLWRTLAALGTLREAQGNPDAAQASYAEGLAEVERVAGTLTDPSLRPFLLAAWSATRSVPV